MQRPATRFFNRAKRTLQAFGLAMSALCFAGLSASAEENDWLIIPPDSVDDPVQIVKLRGAANTDPSEFDSLLRVFVDRGQTSCCRGRSPIAGSYELSSDRLIFFPLFQFQAGQSYTIALQDPESAIDLPSTENFILQPKEAVQPPVIDAIYPSGRAIPENTLRFYVHFSKPMMPHVSFEYIELINALGETDDAAFMEFKQELWSQDRRRLTLLIDPGRIKRGVDTNQRLGPALLEGGTYQLRVKAGWPSAGGEILDDVFSHEFTVTAPIRRRAEIADWKVLPPTLYTRSPLRLEFDRPFDHQQLLNELSVVDTGTNQVAGSVSVSTSEQVWEFTPDEPWQWPEVFINLPSTLEDVAGNNFREALDRPTSQPIKEIDRVSIPVLLLAASKD